MAEAEDKQKGNCQVRLYRGEQLDGILTLNPEEYKKLKDNQGFYTSKNDILFLKEVFRPDKRIKKISSVDEVKLKKCLEKYVISITYRGPHSVQFEIRDGETKQIITFYTRLKDAFTELSKITDCFYPINTRYIANYHFIDKEKIIKREIVVNGTSHRVNKNYVQNVELIKRRSI